MARLSEMVIGTWNNLFNRSVRRRIGDEWFYKELDSKFVWGGVNPLLSFMEVPEVNAVINKRATMFSNGKPMVVNRAGKAIPKDDFLLRLQKPNWYQSFEEFVKNTRIFRDVYGEEFMYLQFPIGYTSEDFKNIFCLPPENVTLKLKAEQPFWKFEELPVDNIVAKYKHENKEYNLDYRSLVHINDNNICESQEKMLRGSSKLEALKVVVNNIRTAYESRGVILKHRGALGILSNDGQDAAGAVPLDPKEKTHLEESYARKYGTLSGQQQLIITNARVKWQNMMVNNPMNLGLYKEVEEDFAKLLDSYGMPKELFISATGSTYENQNQARKAVYENTIIPEAAEWCRALNKQFFADTPHKFILDYFHLPIFQEDIKHRTEALQTAANALTVLYADQQISMDEYREELAKLGIGDGKSLVKEETDDASAQTAKGQAELRSSVGGVTSLIALMTAVQEGKTSVESARATLVIIYGMTPEQAAQIIIEPPQPATTETNPQPIQQDEQEQTN
jgi:hypothetical protein